MIHPKYREHFASLGFTQASDFLSLTGTVISGHPDRQVSKVSIGNVDALLKVEHRVPWKQRWENAWQGFGFVSKSEREAKVLQRLESTSIHVPQWLACGEDEQGQAFLLLELIPNVLPLVRYLEQIRHRRCILSKLGQTVAQLHAQGFDHPDLYANHVLIQPETETLWLIDWQRSRHRSVVPWKLRCRDLSALSATLLDDLVSDRERLVFMKSYLEEANSLHLLQPCLQRITKLHNKLRQRRHIRSKLRLSSETHSPRLISIDGERLQITPAFQQRWPDWHGKTIVEMPFDSEVVHDQSRHQQADISPQRTRMNLLNRLHRYGVIVPQVLAISDVSQDDGWIESSLLTLPPSGTISVKEYIHSQVLSVRHRAKLLRSVGQTLAKIHQAGCFFETSLDALGVQHHEGTCQIVLSDIQELQLRRNREHAARWHNFKLLRDELRLSKTEQWRTLGAYLQVAQSDPMTKRQRKAHRLARLLRANT